LTLNQDVAERAALLDNLPAPAEEFDVNMNEVGKKADARTNKF